MIYIQKRFSTPRPLMSDAYTICSANFESAEAMEYSEYYLTFRQFPYKLDPDLYDEGDERIVFAGLQRIIDRLLAKPIKHWEIDETVEFLKNRKPDAAGKFSDFDFPEQLWRDCVDKFGGHLPIEIEAMPEGSVVYPNEPVVRVRSIVKGYGPLAAWFESSLVGCWAATERLTAARHWLKYNYKMIRSIEPASVSNETVGILASLMMHDFGARAAMCNQESEDVAYSHLYCFGGTDTFEAAYQAWKNGAPSHIGCSIWALAHRIVQGYAEEGNCYRTIYDRAPNNSLISMVADCYNFKYAVENYLLPLAKESVKKRNSKVIVVRPDSGDALVQILWTLNLAVENGLYEEKNGYKYMTSLRIIEGDSMTFERMKTINWYLLHNGFAPHGCLIYGVGGHLRNSIRRDNMSTKYALCAVGGYDSKARNVIKLSEVAGKRTLPSAIVIRTPEALSSGVTITRPALNTNDAFVIYYNGMIAGERVFGPGMEDDFTVIQKRVINDFDKMPLTGGMPTQEIMDMCSAIEEKYCPQPVRVT